MIPLAAGGSCAEPRSGCMAMMCHITCHATCYVPAIACLKSYILAAPDWSEQGNAARALSAAGWAILLWLTGISLRMLAAQFLTAVLGCWAASCMRSCYTQAIACCRVAEAWSHQGVPPGCRIGAPSETGLKPWGLGIGGLLTIRLLHIPLCLCRVASHGIWYASALLAFQSK